MNLSDCRKLLSADRVRRVHEQHPNKSAARLARSLAIQKRAIRQRLSDVPTLLQRSVNIVLLEEMNCLYLDMRASVESMIVESVRVR